MSEKIKKMLASYADRKNAYIASTRVCPDWEVKEYKTEMEEAEQAILAEFAKLNAVREKLVEACKAFPGDNWAEKKAAALAANAELEGK